MNEYGLGFVLAGAYNWCILIFSRCGTNQVLMGADTLFDYGGIVGVLLWGAAYVSVYKDYEQAPYIILVFAFEKLYYVFHWFVYLKKNGIRNWSAQSTDGMLATAFYAIYGIGDFVSMLFFFFVFFHI